MPVIVWQVSRSTAKHTSSFFRPVFCLSAYPEMFRVMDCWHPLLEMRFYPIVWKVLFTKYEGMIGGYKSDIPLEAGVFGPSSGDN